jgi:hypothetical protein
MPTWDDSIGFPASSPVATSASSTRTLSASTETTAHTTTGAGTDALSMARPALQSRYSRNLRLVTSVTRISCQERPRRCWHNQKCPTCLLRLRGACLLSCYHKMDRVAGTIRGGRSLTCGERGLSRKCGRFLESKCSLRGQRPRSQQTVRGWTGGQVAWTGPRM